MTAEEIARYNESLLCVPGEAARLRDLLTRLRGRDVRWGVSVRRTSLRAKPTDALCPTRAGDRYDDALQLTAVLPNEPMALLGESADGRFCRAETSYYAGWVPAEDIGLCRDLEAWRTAQEGGFLRVTGSRVTLCCDPYEPRVSSAVLPMGTRLPLAAPPGTVRALRGRMSYDNYFVRLPVRRTLTPQRTSRPRSRVRSQSLAASPGTHRSDSLYRAISSAVIKAASSFRIKSPPSGVFSTLCAAAGELSDFY